MHFRLFLTQPFQTAFRMLLQALATQLTFVFTPDSPKFTILSDSTYLVLLQKSVFTNVEISASSMFVLKLQGKPLIDELQYFADSDCSIILSQGQAEKPCLLLNFFQKETDFSENEKEAEKTLKVIYLKGAACAGDLQLLQGLNDQLSVQSRHKMEFLFPHKNTLSQIVQMANCIDDAVELQIVQNGGKRTLTIDHSAGNVQATYYYIARDDEIVCRVAGEGFAKQVKQADLLLKALGLSWGACLIVCEDRVIVQLSWEGGPDMLVQSVFCGLAEGSYPE